MDARWSSMPPADKCVLLERVASEIEKVEGKIAEMDSLNTGIQLSLTREICATLKGAFVAVSQELKAFFLHTDEIEGTFGKIASVRKPWGTVVILSPWNVPGGTVVPKIAAALAMGCPVILKPSEFAPLGLDVLHHSGLQPSLLQLGDQGEGCNVVGADRQYYAAVLPQRRPLTERDQHGERLEGPLVAG